MRASQRGFGVVGWLVMLAFIVSVAASMLMGAGSSKLPDIAVSFNKSATLSMQARLIQAKLISCATEFPSANNGSPGSHLNYPAGLDVTIASVTCPGNGIGLWAQNDAVLGLDAVDGFSLWYYSNTAAGMLIYVTATDTTGADLLPTVLIGIGNGAFQTGSGIGGKITVPLAS